MTTVCNLHNTYCDSYVSHPAHRQSPCYIVIGRVVLSAALAHVEKESDVNIRLIPDDLIRNVQPKNFPHGL